MSPIYAELELINAWELEAVRKNLMDETDVKRTKVKAVVNTGAIMLVINEELQEALQFPVVGKQEVILPDGRIINCDVVNNVEVRFKNRRCTIQAYVLPECTATIMGMVPIEALDLIIDKKNHDLILFPD